MLKVRKLFRDYLSRVICYNSSYYNKIGYIYVVPKFILQFCDFEYKYSESNILQCYLVMDLIKHFWYLIHVERQRETVTV